MADTSTTRTAVTDALFDLSETDPNVILVSSDSVGIIKAQDFVEEHPDRVVEVGISEQAAMAASAGLAASGLKPVYVSYSVFATMRACEQFRTMVAYPGLNVTVIGANGGMGAGEREGVTHQGFEDLGIVRAIPGITVISPSDAAQVREAIKQAVDIPGPVYIRTGSGREPRFWEEDKKFRFNQPSLFFEGGSDVVLFAHGFVLQYVKRACEYLSRENIGCTAVEIATLKPLNAGAIEPYIRDCSVAVVVEDHTVIGGLGSAVCEYSAEYRPTPVLRIGLADTYPESGTADELYDKYGLSAQAITSSVTRFLSKYV